MSLWPSKLNGKVKKYENSSGHSSLVPFLLPLSHNIHSSYCCSKFAMMSPGRVLLQLYHMSLVSAPKVLTFCEMGSIVSDH